MAEGQQAAPPTGGAQPTRSGSAVQREAEFARKGRTERELEELKAIEEQAARTEAFREEFEASEQGALHRQIREVERIMRGPSPAQHWVDHEGNVRATGNTACDPTKGPSS